MGYRHENAWKTGQNLVEKGTGPKVLETPTTPDHSDTDKERRTMATHGQYSDSACADNTLKSDKPCFVYAIASEGMPNFVKVGISANPEARVNALQSAHPHFLYIHKAFKFPSRSAAAGVEAIAHKIMDDARALREWFSVAPSVATAVIQTAATLNEGGGRDADIAGASQRFFNYWRGAA